jgi:hypothetical protein
MASTAVGRANRRRSRRDGQGCTGLPVDQTMVKAERLRLDDDPAIVRLPEHDAITRADVEKIADRFGKRQLVFARQGRGAMSLPRWRFLTSRCDCRTDLARTERGGVTPPRDAIN